MTKMIARNILICLVLLLLLGVVFYLFGLLFGFAFDMVTHDGVHLSFKLFAWWYAISAAFFVPFVAIWTWRNERRLAAMNETPD